jgi:hypothetical protein
MNCDHRPCGGSTSWPAWSPAPSPAHGSKTGPHLGTHTSALPRKQYAYLRYSVQRLLGPSSSMEQHTQRPLTLARDTDTSFTCDPCLSQGFESPGPSLPWHWQRHIPTPSAAAARAPSQPLSPRSPLGWPHACRPLGAGTAQRRRQGTAGGSTNHVQFTTHHAKTKTSSFHRRRARVYHITQCIRQHRWTHRLPTL